jgi:hypothetical protein
MFDRELLPYHPRQTREYKAIVIIRDVLIFFLKFVNCIGLLAEK